MFAQETSLTDDLNSEREKCILTTFFFSQIEMWGLGERRGLHAKNPYLLPACVRCPGISWVASALMESVGF